jgi:site-specific DNA-methyltransferase (adenine-specific)
MMAQKLETKPSTESAKQWSGWGTALKPAWEPIILCRKPLDGTVAENVQKWGTGAINIDGCRIGVESTIRNSNAGTNGEGWGMGKYSHINGSDKGRFPANLIHDGSDEVLEEFPQNAGAFAPVKSGMNGKSKGIYGDFAQKGDDGASFRGDSDSAARFFYCAKASKSERNLGLPEGTTNKHPTVKPLSLIEYLIKLISVENAIVLDPFTGSGTTGIACTRLGRKFVGYELDKESFITAETRLKKAQEQGKISEWF